MTPAYGGEVSKSRTHVDHHRIRDLLAGQRFVEPTHSCLMIELIHPLEKVVGDRVEEQLRLSHSISRSSVLFDADVSASVDSRFRIEQTPVRSPWIRSEIHRRLATRRGLVVQGWICLGRLPRDHPRLLTQEPPGRTDRQIQPDKPW